MHRLSHLPRPPSLHYFFFLMLPPPPRSTLFPYTTLFRSLSERAADLPQLDLKAGDVGAADPGLLRIHRHPQDRKSTRLNSSHRTISYAVFCLKKKKNIKKRIKMEQSNVSKTSPDAKRQLH